MEVKFKRDTQFRKLLFDPDSFAHPAKMDAQLLLWLVEKYTKPGDVILDPMAGSGTTMLACGLGRSVILVELEQKFVRMQVHNWDIVKMHPQLGFWMGECRYLWGDARNVLSAREHPYRDLWLKYPKLDYQAIKSLRRHYGLPLFDDARNLQGLLCDRIITSPPFGGAEATDARKTISDTHFHTGQGADKLLHYDKGNIGNLPYGEIDNIITSPPYAQQVSATRSYELDPERRKQRLIDAGYDINEYQLGTGRQLTVEWGYGKSNGQIGNLKSTSYLEAMLQVYRQCYKVLKPQGLMILVTKNFIREKQVIRLDEDTMKLCEKAGFIFVERHYRKLPGQSFWRIIYKQKYPEVEIIDREDVMVFIKQEAPYWF